MNDVQILAPTWLEYLAVRRVLPHANVIRTGVALAQWHGTAAGSIVVVCGLAGALAPEVQPGTILVPEQVGLPDGRVIRCDTALVRALAEAARALGIPTETGPILTAPALVVGAERGLWAKRGFVGADMEAGLLADCGVRVATVRAVLDSPSHDISQLWLRPAEVVLRPRLWGELFWLSRAAPSYALLAARVLRAGLERLPA
jgi:4-hydroxy-3-methylbut-2-enyl diphosphate reductase